MAKTVVIIGALDTKGDEFAFVKNLIEHAGVQTLVVDFGVMGAPAFAPDITREEVVAAAGGDLNYLASGDHKDEAMLGASNFNRIHDIWGSIIGFGSELAVRLSKKV